MVTRARGAGRPQTTLASTAGDWRSYFTVALLPTFELSSLTGLAL